MRIIFFFLFLLLANTTTQAQEQTEGLERFNIAGKEGFYRMVALNLRIPRFCRENNIQGKVYVAFNVLPEGKLDSVHIFGDSHLILGDEAKLVVKLTEGYWKPADTVTKLVLPFVFTLRDYAPRNNGYDEKVIKKYEKFKTSREFPYSTPEYFASRKAAYDGKAEKVKLYFSLPEPSTLDVKQLFEQGTALVQAKRYSKARKYLEELIKKDKTHKDGLFNLGVCYFQLGDKSRACATWKYLQSLGDKTADEIIKANCQ